MCEIRRMIRPIQFLASLVLFLLPYAGHGQKAPDLNALDRYIADAMMKFDQPGMAVGIVSGGKLIWSNGYGKLDLSRPEPVTPNSIFFAASISKAFTSASIGLLVDEGRIAWDDPVRKYMPEFNTPDPYVTNSITIRDLLCHRSGWATFDGDLLWYGTEYSQAEILERHSKEPFAYGFRDKYGYSNLMFIAAAQVIEHVTGMSWGSFVTERILQPLGMTRTTVSTSALATMGDVALPHVRNGQDPSAPQKSIAYQALRGADGATGINTCVVDLAKWDAMWAAEGEVNGKPFLQRRTWLTLTTDHMSFAVPPERAKDGEHYSGAALGWFTEDHLGAKVITHSGGMPGFILNHAVVPEKDLAVIALGNGESYAVFAVTDKIIDLYLGKPTSDPVAAMLPRIKVRDERDEQRRADRLANRMEGTSPTLAIDSLQGSFKDRIYGDARIDLKDGSANLTLLPAKELFDGPLSHWHHDTYLWRHADPFLEPGYVTFHFDTDHHLTHFTIELHSPDFHFHKLEFRPE